MNKVSPPKISYKDLPAGELWVKDFPPVYENINTIGVIIVAPDFKSYRNLMLYDFPVAGLSLGWKGTLPRKQYSLPNSKFKSYNHLIRRIKRKGYKLQARS